MRRSELFYRITPLSDFFGKLLWGHAGTNNRLFQKISSRFERVQILGE